MTDPIGDGVAPPAEATPEITRVYLGGGGWRGAFGSIGAVAFLDDTGRWSAVEDVVAISGGSFLTGLLAASDPSEPSPMPVLADATQRLLGMAAPMKRRLAALAATLPLAIAPPVFLVTARALLSWLWRDLLGRRFPEVPRTEGSRRYIIAAAGRETARRYSFVAGLVDGDPVKQPICTWVVPTGWRVADAIASSTALPWVSGYRVPNQLGEDGRGERLIDGGILGIFGTQTFESDPLGTSPGDDRRSLVLDAGRVHRRGGRVIEWISATSTVLLLGRWVQIGLDGSFRRSLDEALSAPPISEERRLWVHLVRVAETDRAEQHLPGVDDEVVRRIAQGRRDVNRFGLTGLNRLNAFTTIVVAIAASAFDVFPSVTAAEIREQLDRVSARLGLEDALPKRWDEL